MHDAARTMSLGLEAGPHPGGWDLVEPVYERHWGRHLAPAQGRLLELAAVRSGERVLDVACGTGAVTLPAAWAVGPSGYVLATDRSEAMVQRTTLEASREGIRWLEGRRTRAEDPIEREDDFDAALCAFGLAYVTEPARALASMGAALRPDGRVALAVWGDRVRCGWFGVFDIVDRVAGTDMQGAFHHLGDGDRLADAIAAAGFIDIRVERIPAWLRYPSARAAADAAFAQGPVAAVVAGLDRTALAEARTQYLTLLEPCRRGRGFHVPVEFVVARAMRPQG